MRAARARIAAIVLAALTLSACAGDRNPQLMNLRSETRGPDEFGILPTKPSADAPNETAVRASSVELMQQILMRGFMI